jgi:ferrochelatase
MTAPIRTAEAQRTGILLMNLGSPDSTEVGDVRTYLQEFLMDGRVIDAPWPIRYLIVHGFVLPFRPAKSAEAYRTIWTPEGSPLIVMSRRVQRLLQERIPQPVELAMRYRLPRVDGALQALQNQGVEEVVLIPLFPHYAMSSYESAVEEVRRCIREHFPDLKLKICPPYYRHPAYLEALATTVSPHLATPWDHLLISFHGIPQRHLRKSDPTRSHCLKAASCCDRPHSAHATCYRHQCHATAAGLVEKAGLPPGKVSVSFQSRLGRDAWIQPYTEPELERLARSGVRRLKVLCPAFVSDCLETLEEIAVRGREVFQHHGGEELELIPCLNDHSRWIDALVELARETAEGTVPQPA